MDWTHKARIALAACIMGFAGICGVQSITYANVQQHPYEEAHYDVPVPSQQQFSFLGFAGTLFSEDMHPVPSLKPDFANRSALSSADQKQYESVFALQEAGNIEQADRYIRKIKDKILMGHVLYQRYMHPVAYQSRFEELAEWMSLYSDHPGAKDIYALAQKRMPEGYDGELVEPSTGRSLARAPEPGMHKGKRFKPSDDFTEAQYNAAKGEAKKAQKAIYAGQIDEALMLAKPVADISGNVVPGAAWVAGLAHWKKGEFAAAAQYFEMTASSEYVSGWKSAAGAFWAARSHMRAGNDAQVIVWLEKAEANPRTFYGLLAMRALGNDFSFNWKKPTFTKDHYELLSRTAEGHRAMALVSVGEMHRAESELMVMEPETKPMRKALLAYAFYADLPALEMRLGALHRGSKGKFYDAALYPVTPWTPDAGYRIDPALVHAIMRQESRFNPAAESHSGARGLMQLMPSTATYVSGEDVYKSESGMHLLNDPETNIDIGQLYVKKLLRSKSVKDDMLALLMAYNAGPGNLQRWQNNMAQVEDPLLFIELIPISETRNYVERVLSNYWIYRHRDGLATPSLDALAAGRVARYAGMPGEMDLASAQ